MKNPYLRRLSTLLLLVPALLGLPVVTGCSSTRAPDPVRVEQVKGVMQQSVASAALLGIQKDKKAAPYLSAAAIITCDLASRKQLSPAELSLELSKSDIDALKTVEGQLALNTVISVYSVYFAERLRSDVSEKVYVSALLDTLCVGINQGIQQAKDAGLIP